MKIHQFPVCFFLIVMLGSPILSVCQFNNPDEVITALRDKDFNKALEYLDNEIAENEDNGVAYYYRAWLYWNKLEENAKALKDVNKAIELLTKKEKQWKAKAYQLRADIYMATEEYDKGLQDLDKSIKLEPKNSEYYASRAEYYAQKDNFNLAEKDYLKSLKLDEANESALTGFAFLLMHVDRMSEAEKLLNKLLILNPSSETGYRYRAALKYKRHLYEEAIADIFIAYEFSGEHSDILSQLLSYSEKNLNLAIAKASEKIIANAGVGGMYFVRARLNDKQHNLQAAIADYTQMIDRADAAYAAQLYGYRAICYKKGGAFENATRDANMLIRSDTTNSYSYLTRSEIYREKKEYGLALRDLDTAITLNPMEGWFYFSRAAILTKLSEFEKARNDYDKCLAINPQYLPALLRRGMLFKFELKNELKANVDFRAIISIDKEIGEGPNYTAYAFQLIGEKNKAQQISDSLTAQYPTYGHYYELAGLNSLDGNIPKSIDALKQSIDLGFRDLKSLEHDPLFSIARKDETFNDFVMKQSMKYAVQLKDTKFESELNADSAVTNTATIPMKPKGNGVYEISCKVNDLKLNFIFDTGASDISISQTEATFMLKNGYLEEKDIMGAQRYMDANGNIELGTRILLRKVDFGGMVLKNISASVVNNKKAPLLFGQSALSKYAKIIIDNNAGKITISIK